MTHLRFKFNGKVFEVRYLAEQVDKYIRYTVFIEDPALLSVGDSKYVFLRQPVVSVGSGFVPETKFLFKNTRLRWTIQHALEESTDASHVLINALEAIPSTLSK